MLKTLHQNKLKFTFYESQFLANSIVPLPFPFPSPSSRVPCNNRRPEIPPAQSMRSLRLLLFP